MALHLLDLIKLFIFQGHKFFYLDPFDTNLIYQLGKDSWSQKQLLIN